MECEDALQLKSFGRDLGVDLGLCFVAVFEDVVIVVQVGESFNQRQFVPETLVDPDGQLAWCQLAGQHRAASARAAASCPATLPAG